MIPFKHLKLAAALCAVGAVGYTGTAQAVEVAGFEFSGYSRGGPVLRSSDNVKGGLALGGEEFQQKFNLAKGSIPARLNVKLDAFDACARTSARDFSATAKSGKLLPSVSQGMAVPPAVEEAFKGIVSRYWSDDRFTTAMAMKALLDAIPPKK